jgi:ABC-type bacteriocin/lantibiotic exporter with double-glycine peptidase domain
MAPAGPASGPGSGAIHFDHHPSPLHRLRAWLYIERADIGVALVYVVGVGLISLAAPAGVQTLVNSVAFGGMLQPLVVLTLLVLAALAFAAVLRAMQAWVIERIQQRVFVRVALDLSRRLPRVRASALHGSHGPELVNRFFDMVTVQKGAATLLVDGASVVLSVIVGALVLAFYHPILLVFDLALIAMLAVLFLLGRGGVHTSVEESKAKYALAAWLEETVRHPSSFRSAAGAAFAETQADELTWSYLTARRAHFRVLYRQIVAALVIQALATAALLGVGGWLVMVGKITLGQLVAAELIVTAVVAGIAKLGKYLESYYDLCAAADKLGHLFDLPLEASGSAELPRTEVGAHVSVCDVWFRHGERGRVILAGANLEIKPGATVAVIGANGSGKSTLADLIYGLQAPGYGRVEIDGVDVPELDLALARSQIALVRGVEIFDGTVAENVGMGRPGVGTVEIRAALEAVGLADAIAALPEGLATRLSTDGAELSAGQAHRLMLARAIAGSPRLLVLDETLDDLDSASRLAVARALFSPRERPWSVLVTTHNRDVLRECDEIYVLDEGTFRPLRAEDLSGPASARALVGEEV